RTYKMTTHRAAPNRVCSPAECTDNVLNTSATVPKPPNTMGRETQSAPPVIGPRRTRHLIASVSKPIVLATRMKMASGVLGAGEKSHVLVFSPWEVKAPIEPR